MISVLLIDDNRTKRTRVAQAIRTRFDGVELRIDEATCTVDGAKHLRANSYDLLVLDIFLPLRPNTDPKPNGGIQLLDDLSRRSDFNKPRHIIGLTAFSKIKHQAQTRFDREAWNLIHYDDSKNDWIDVIANKLAYVLGGRHGSQFNLDILIITALEIELDAIKRAFNISDQNREKKGTRVYWRFSINLPTGGEYSAVACKCSDAGNADSLAITIDALRDWRPQVAIFSGIAGSLNKKAKLGDVVVSKDVFYFERGKMRSATSIDPEPKCFPADALLWNSALNLPAWKGKIVAPRPDGKDIRPSLHFESVLSGEKVIVDKDFRKRNSVLHRKLYAVEMEGYGFSKAAFESFAKLRWIQIRSISDGSNKNKADHWHAYAAAAAASFTKHLILDKPIEPLGATLFSGD